MLQKFDERNRDLIVNIGGELVHRDQSGVSPFDSVVQGGDGVWEGLRLYDGRIFRLIEHLDRLQDSAKALAFTDIPSHKQIIHQIRRTLKANGMVDGIHVRLTLTRGVKITSGMDPRLNQSGHTLIVLAEFKSPVYDRGGLSFITSSIRRFPPDCLDPKIHHNNLIQSILAKIEANHAGVDQALMLDKNGFIAEAHGTHVFFVRRDGVFKPDTFRGKPPVDGKRIWWPLERIHPRENVLEVLLRAEREHLHVHLRAQIKVWMSDGWNGRARAPGAPRCRA